MSTTITEHEVESVSLDRLEKDLRDATATLDVRQARYLVDTYYMMQEHRIALAGQRRSMVADEEPHEAVQFFLRQMATVEKQVASVLDAWTATQQLGLWARGQKGIGPVLAAGLLAHIDVAKAPTAGHVWNFAGLNPDVTWGKGEKRPWNADLKVICWKIGQSFMKVSGRDDAFYGQLYKQRKQYEINRNEQVREIPFSVVQTANPDVTMGSLKVVQGDSPQVVVTIDGQASTAYCIGERWFVDGNARSAHQALARKKIGKTTIAYKAYAEGRLPDAQILARSTRWVTKLFLAHYLEVGRRQLGLEVPQPYPIAHLGHTHIIEPPI